MRTCVCVCVCKRGAGSGVCAGRGDTVDHGPNGKPMGNMSNGFRLGVVWNLADRFWGAKTCLCRGLNFPSTHTLMHLPVALGRGIQTRWLLDLGESHVFGGQVSTASPTICQMSGFQHWVLMGPARFALQGSPFLIQSPIKIGGV